jgi:hypothetical protein
MLSATYFEIAVNFPTYLPERDNSFPEAKHETQFTTERQNTSKSPKFTGRSQLEENPCNEDVDVNQRNLSRGDGSDVNNQKNGKKLNCTRDHRNSVNDHKGIEAFEANMIWCRTHIVSGPRGNCTDFDLTCMLRCTDYFALRKLNN